MAKAIDLNTFTLTWFYVNITYELVEFGLSTIKVHTHSVTVKHKYIILKYCEQEGLQHSDNSKYQGKITVMPSGTTHHQLSFHLQAQTLVPAERYLLSVTTQFPSESVYASGN